jgi:hypothetical protein
MSFIAEGKVTELLVLIAAAGFAYLFLYRAIQGKPEKLRHLPVIDAMSEGVDRAVETGQPVFVSPGGYGYLSGMYASMTLAGMALVRHVTRLAVQRGAQVALPVPTNPQVQPLIDGIYRESCVLEGKPEIYDPGRVRYFGNESQAYAMGITSWLGVEGVACYMVIGPCGGGIDTTPLLWAREAGAICIGGTARWFHNGTFTVMCDYPVHQDDVYAVGAVLSGDPVVISSMVGGDFLKIICIGMILIGAVLYAAGIDFPSWLLM